MVLALVYHLVSQVLFSAPDAFPYYFVSSNMQLKGYLIYVIQYFYVFFNRIVFSGHLIRTIAGNGGLTFVLLPSWFLLPLALGPTPHRGME